MWQAGEKFRRTCIYLIAKLISAAKAIARRDNKNSSAAQGPVTLTQGVQAVAQPRLNSTGRVISYQTRKAETHIDNIHFIGHGSKAAGKIIVCAKI